MKRAHGLESHDASCLGSPEDLERLRLGGAEGLFDDNVLTAGDAGERLLVMECVGAADVDGIDVVGGRELVECGEVAFAAVLSGEGGAAICIARERTHKRGLVVGVDDLDKVVGNHGCADGCDAQHVSPSCRSVYRMSVARGGKKWRAKTPLQVALVKAGVDIEIGSVGRGGGELVAALIELVAGMPLNPDELHLMLTLCGKQALP